MFGSAKPAGNAGPAIANTFAVIEAVLVIIPNTLIIEAAIKAIGTGENSRLYGSIGLGDGRDHPVALARLVERGFGGKSRHVHLVALLSGALVHRS